MPLKIPLFKKIIFELVPKINTYDFLSDLVGIKIYPMTGCTKDPVSYQYLVTYFS